jgi:hypothetical protein
MPDTPGKPGSISALWLGILLSVTINSTLGALIVAYTVLMGLGIGMSSNPEANYTVMQSIKYCWGCSPVVINLPALAYTLVTRRWRFLGGWFIGLIASALLTGLAVGALALLIYVISQSAR